MFWHEVDLSRLQIDAGRGGRTKFSYDGKPFKFQIPESRCVWGLSEYKSLSIQMEPDFIEWWRKLEEYIDPPDPYSSSIRDDTLRIKLDEYTQVFDSKRQVDIRERNEGDFRGAMLKCIIEVSGMYYFNGTYGLTCRIYQLLQSDAKVEHCECEFIDLPAS